MYDNVEFTEVSQRGCEAYMNGMNPEPPYNKDTEKYDQWMKGWHQSYESYDGDVPTHPNMKWKHHSGENYEQINPHDPHNPHGSIGHNPHQEGF